MQITINMKAHGTVNVGPLDRHRIEDLLVEIELNVSARERFRSEKGKPAGFNALICGLRDPYDVSYPWNAEFMSGNHEFPLAIPDAMALELVACAKEIELDEAKAPLLCEIIDACRAVADFNTFVERNTRMLLQPYQPNA